MIITVFTVALVNMPGSICAATAGFINQSNQDIKIHYSTCKLGVMWFFGGCHGGKHVDGTVLLPAGKRVTVKVPDYFFTEYGETRNLSATQVLNAQSTSTRVFSDYSHNDIEHLCMSDNGGSVPNDPLYPIFKITDKNTITCDAIIKSKNGS